jgi:hypothetical protein
VHSKLVEEQVERSSIRRFSSTSFRRLFVVFPACSTSRSSFPASLVPADRILTSLQSPEVHRERRERRCHRPFALFPRTTPKQSRLGPRPSAPQSVHPDQREAPGYFALEEPAQILPSDGEGVEVLKWRACVDDKSATTDKRRFSYRTLHSVLHAQLLLAPGSTIAVREGGQRAGTNANRRRTGAQNTARSARRRRPGGALLNAGSFASTAQRVRYDCRAVATVHPLFRFFPALSTDNADFLPSLSSLPPFPASNSRLVFIRRRCLLHHPQDHSATAQDGNNSSRGF